MRINLTIPNPWPWRYSMYRKNWINREIATRNKRIKICLLRWPRATELFTFRITKGSLRLGFIGYEFMLDAYNTQ